MDFRELAYVIAVSEEKNMTKAAEKLFVAQPTLSQTISSVEKKYGQKLFQRHPQGVTLTYAGETFVSFAHRILDTKNELDIEMDRISRLGSGRIRVGIPTFLSTYILPLLLPRFSSQFPDVEIEIIEDLAMFLEERLSRKAIELAILTMPLINDSIPCEYFLTEKILIVISEKNPLSQLGVLRPGERFHYIAPELIRDEKCVLPPKLTQIRNTVEVFFRTNNIRPKIEMVTSNLDTCCSLAAGNVGIAFIPEHYITQADRLRGLMFFETDDSLKPWKMGIAGLETNQSEQQNALIKAISQTIKDIFKQEKDRFQEGTMDG